MDSNVLTLVCTIVVTALGSSGLWSYLQYRQEKKNKTAETLKDIQKQISDLDKKVDINEAKLARQHILRFDDELLNNIPHSQQYFRQVIEEDIKTYEGFCRDNPDFPNGYTVEAVKHITDVYGRLWHQHKL